MEVSLSELTGLSHSVIAPKLRLSSSKSCQHHLRCDYLPENLLPFSLFCSICLVLRQNKWTRTRGCERNVSVFFTGPLTKEIESEITRSPASNTRRPADKNLGPMLPITKDILRDFYTPFNEKLAKVLQNDSFLWENNSKLWTSQHHNSCYFRKRKKEKKIPLMCQPAPLDFISLKCPLKKTNNKIYVFLFKLFF